MIFAKDSIAYTQSVNYYDLVNFDRILFTFVCPVRHCVPGLPLGFHRQNNQDDLTRDAFLETKKFVGLCPQK